MKKTKLLLVVLFLISSPLTLHRSRVFAEDSLFDSEIEKQIMEEGAKKAKERAEAKKKAKEEAEKQKEGMVLVEGGTFQMGSTSGGSYEKIIHSVTVSSFYIGKYETTQAEYEAIMGSNPSRFKNSNNPVEQVSWFDAIKYCNAKSKKEGFPVAYNESTGDLLDSNGYSTNHITKVKGYRLPTEAEWEYAARGGNKSNGYTYAGGNTPDEVAVNVVSSYKKGSSSEYKTYTVGSKKPNELGLYDMSGNVWEWCTDWYSDIYYSNSTTINPVNTKSAYDRVVRGSGWSNANADDLRVDNRNNNTPTRSDDNLGFRLSRTGELAKQP